MLRLRYALIGFGIAVVLVGYQGGTNTSGAAEPSMAVIGVLVVLCPPYLLSIPLWLIFFAAAAIGTPAFYVICFVSQFNECDALRGDRAPSLQLLNKPELLSS